MIKLITILLILSLPQNPGPSVTGGVGGTNNFLVGRWFLCGDTNPSSGCVATPSTAAYDSSGGGNNGAWVGTQSGSTDWYSAGYVLPYAGAFDGSTNYLNLGTSSVITPAIFTVSAWVYPTVEPTHYADILADSGGSASNQRYELRTAYGSPNNGLQFVLSNGSSFYTCGDTSHNRFPLNTWTFVAATFSGSALVGYINNGVIACTQSFTGTITTYSGNSTIGQSGVQANPFIGLIEDARVYSVVKTQAQIETIYANGPGGPA